MQFINQQNIVMMVVLIVIAAFVPSVHAESFAGTITYSGRTCSGTPLVVSVINSVDCEDVECLIFIADGTTYSSATTCEKINHQTYVSDVFADSNYVMIETFANECKGFLGAIAFLATGKCQVYDDQGVNYVIAKVNEDGSASVDIYNNSSCTGTPSLGYEPDSETVMKHSCYMDYSVI
ncbi:TKL protein kinase [Phytophthora palmivora]|uniref:TKL protein kinase n=1 Tax=Phytophthora palmivora TaxID=4796 RepID=A0A2P4YPN1_9STRA|nr:TKL protein kinase [Phytophthora palmivora]